MSSSTTSSQRLNGKDLINVGVYTAISIGIIFIIGLFNAFPPAYPVLFVIWPLALAIPMMLYYTKIQKFGMLTITGILSGLFFFMMGYTWVAIVCSSAAGLAADLILKLGGYKKFSAHAVSYAVYCLSLISAPLLLWFAGPSYWDNIEEQMGADYVSALQTLMPSWMLYVGLAALFGFGLIGALFGRRMLSKHFIRAGIA